LASNESFPGVQVAMLRVQDYLSREDNVVCKAFSYQWAMLRLSNGFPVVGSRTAVPCQMRHLERAGKACKL
jgi:hypothetical protein